MSIESVKSYLKEFGVENRIIEAPVSSATVELAAQAFNCEPMRIAKSITFDAEGRYLLIVAAGDAKINNQKFKSHFGTKPKMLGFSDVETIIGHAVGGVCPFAVNPGVDIYLDESLKRFETVFPACGSSNSAIELTIDELEQYSRSLGWVDVCKGWDE
jgi:prolyl-tRNA editing enzyme YbaK/EbsC (Cys-tRNA(Pro) deacylase)